MANSDTNFDRLKLSRCSADLSPVKSQSGQAVIEYVLILVVGVSIAALITRSLVSRNPENPGIITGQWYRMNQVVAEDFPDRLED